MPQCQARGATKSWEEVAVFGQLPEFPGPSQHFASMMDEKCRREWCPWTNEGQTYIRNLTAECFVLVCKIISYFVIMSADQLTETSLRATGIGLMILTTLVVGARAILRAENRTSVHWHDAWLLLGYLFFIAVSSVYVAKANLMFRLLAVQEGRLAPYPSMGEDALDAQKTFFFTSPGLWFTLWSVKFSLLAFYKKIMVNVSLYTKLWWVVLAYCVVVCKLQTMI